MKKSSLIIFILTTVFALISVANETKIQLKLKVGQTVEFEYSTHQFIDMKTGHPMHSLESGEKWKIEFNVIQQISEHKLIIETSPNRFIYNNYIATKPDIHFDSMFPTASGDPNHVKAPTVFYDILCNLRIKMGIDLAKNELIILETDQLDNTIKTWLLNKNITPEEVKTATKEINKRINEIKTIVNDYLFHINNSYTQLKDSIKVDDKDYLVQRFNNYLKLSLQKTIKTEKRTIEYSDESRIDSDNGILRESITKEIEPNVKKGNGQISISAENESKYLLIKDSEKFDGQIIINGFVEKPTSRQIRIEVLSSPYGTEKDMYSTMLDDNNRFSLTIPFNRENFIFFTNKSAEEINSRQNSMAIYAEPGDQINFEVKGDEKNDSIYFTGDKAIENKSLTSYLSKISGVSGNRYGLYTVAFINPADDKFLNSINEYYKIICSSKLSKADFSEEVSLKSIDFISNEIEMLKLNMACELTGISSFIQQSRLTGQEDIFNHLQSFIEEFPITKYYQDYGFFSRLAVSNFAQHQFMKNLRYGNPLAPIQKYSLNYLDYKDNLAGAYLRSNYFSMILAGSPLIREKAAFIANNTISPQRFRLEDQTTWIKMQEKLGGEVISSSNDLELNRQMQKEFVKVDEFLAGNIFHKKVFQTASGDTCAIDHYFGKNPVILYVSCYNWGVERYYFDDLCVKYPDVTFIYLVQGNDFQKWEDYISRGDPKAHQLFLKNDQQSLQRLFLLTEMGSNRILVFDKNGKVINHEISSTEIERYIHAAQNPETEKKEINKSTMMGIIWFLGGVLLLSLSGFLIFKIRIKRKMKKQEQEKRLRELQLAAIRAQMNPHFLFNSLNSVQNLIQKDRAREAHLYLADFAGLIRKVLNNSKREEISLAEELETLSQYIHLEKLRFDFDYELDVDSEIDPNNFMVPSMILQPIAENAITHGLQNKQGSKKLSVSVTKPGTNILIAIEDNGIGLNAARQQKTASNGLGLKMNEERLKIMDEKYGSKYSFRVIDLFESGGEGTRVEISIPDET